MPITPFAGYPNRGSQSPEAFSNSVDSFFSEFPRFVTEANTLIGTVNAVEADTQAIKDAAVSETTAIKDAAVSETTAIKDAAVSETTAIKNATQSLRDQAAGSATASANSAAVATTRAAEAAASANFRGAWSSLSGALNIPASVLHNGQTWRLMVNLANVASAEPGVSSSWTPIVSFEAVDYDNRGSLRTAPEVPGAMAIVDGLGLFTWHAGSDEPDDDESCFATASGRWLLEAAHWDVVGAWLAPDWDESQSADEDLQGKFLTATFANAVSSVSANTTTTATVTVSGAEVGDAVIVTRSGQHTSRPEGHVYGVVTSANTVTVYLCADDVTAYFHTGTWRVTVIKP